MSESFKISIRFWHPSEATSAIVDNFDLEVMVSNGSGERRRTPSGSLLEGRYSETHVSLGIVSSARAGFFEDHMDSVLRVLDERSGWLTQFRATGGRCELLVGWFVEGSSGFRIEHHLLLRLGNLGVDFSIMMEPPN